MAGLVHEHVVCAHRQVADGGQAAATALQLPAEAAR